MLLFTRMSAAASNASLAKPARLLSIDAFRGLTILGMVFFIAVAAGGYQNQTKPLPGVRSWFGSLPVSTFFHAEVGYEMWEKEYVQRLRDQGFALADIRAAVYAAPEHKLQGIGVTVTDLAAPWFVLIVGVCVPLSLSRRKDEAMSHAWRRAGALIFWGIIYISLVVKQLSFWWGVLQAIGVAYLCAVWLYRAPPKWRLPIILGIGAIHIALTRHFPWWTNAWEEAPGSAFSMICPSGHWLKPLTLHCQPWLSISYGLIAMIGVLVGTLLLTTPPSALLRRLLFLGVVFAAVGYCLHRCGFWWEEYTLCMNKSNVTTSYVFFTGGLGVLVYAFFYGLIDMMRCHAWVAPLAVFGVNPLLAYFMQVVMRRTLESLGLIGFFQKISPDNFIIQNWARLFGEAGQPSQAVLAFFDKSGWMGVVWGLIWVGCLWVVILAFNKRQIFWKL